MLVDFGFALASGANPAARERLQREAAPAGTLLYMAPEQILGEPSDARADSLLTGLYPLRGAYRPAPVPRQFRGGDQSLGHLPERPCRRRR